jgi:FimV-like protein
MKCVLASVTVCALLFASACSQSPEKLLASANKYHENKKYDEASILYQKILVKDKTNAEAYYRLGLNLLDQGKGNEASQALRRAVDLKPSNTDAETKLAEIYLFAYQRDPKRAKNLVADIKDLDNKILQQNPNSFDGLRIQGLSALVVDHDLAKAQESFAKANHVKPYARDLIGVYADVLVQSGKVEEGIALVKDMLAHDKTWGLGYDFLYVQYARTGQRDKAEAVLRERVDADPTSAVGIVNYANYRLQTGDFAGAEQLMQRMVKDPKDFPNAELLLGDFYIRAKKPDLAQAAYDAGKKVDTKDAVQYEERLIGLQAATNHAPQALGMAKDLVDKNPKNASASDIYAELLLRNNTRDTSAKTVEEIKKMLDANPASTLLRLDLAKAYFEMNDRDKALPALEQVINDEQKTGRARAAIVISAQTLEARIYGERGDNAKALELTTKLLAARPGDPDALLIRARALIATGQGATAQPELEALLQRFPNLTEGHIQLGDVYLNQHQFEKASAQFEAASKASPPDARAVIGLQTVKLFSGHPAEAIQGMQDLVSKNPSNVFLRRELARFETMAASMPPNLNQPAGRQLLQQAADNYKQIVATNGSQSDVWLNLGLIQRALGENDAALASFEQAETTNPKNAAAFLNQALLLSLLNRKKEAIDSYNKVLNLVPDNAQAMNNLAFLSAESGTNLDQAQTYAEQAKKKAPNNPDVNDTLGYVYLQKNLNKQAADIFRQNVQQHPDNPSFRFHLAMALLKEGDKQGAKEQASKALQGAASTPDLQNKIKAFVGQIG